MVGLEEVATSHPSRTCSLEDPQGAVLQSHNPPPMPAEVAVLCPRARLLWPHLGSRLSVGLVTDWAPPEKNNHNDSLGKCKKISLSAGTEAR